MSLLTIVIEDGESLKLCIAIAAALLIVFLAGYAQGYRHGSRSK